MEVSGECVDESSVLELGEGEENDEEREVPGLEVGASDEEVGAEFWLPAAEDMDEPGQRNREKKGK